MIFELSKIMEKKILFLSYLILPLFVFQSAHSNDATSTQISDNESGVDGNNMLTRESWSTERYENGVLVVRNTWNRETHYPVIRNYTNYSDVNEKNLNNSYQASPASSEQGSMTDSNNNYNSGAQYNSTMPFISTSAQWVDSFVSESPFLNINTQSVEDKLRAERIKNHFLDLLDNSDKKNTLYKPYLTSEPDSYGFSSIGNDEGQFDSASTSKNRNSSQDKQSSKNGSKEDKSTTDKVEKIRRVHFQQPKDQKTLLLESSKNGYGFTRAGETLESYYQKHSNEKQYNYTDKQPQTLEALDAIDEGESPNQDNTNPAELSKKKKLFFQSKPNKFGSCKVVSATGASLENYRFKNESEKMLAKKCTENRNDRSTECIKFITKAAVMAFSNEDACRKKLTTNKLMCIYKREVTLLSSNPCKIKGACGTSQITDEGNKVVQRGFNKFDLSYEYDWFWDFIGRPQEKQNKCSLKHTDAKDRDTAIVMAATHLCAQIKSSPNRSSAYYNCEYNAGYTGCVNGLNGYARNVESCERASQAEANRQELDIINLASCQNNQSCYSEKRTTFAADTILKKTGSQ